VFKLLSASLDHANVFDDIFQFSQDLCECVGIDECGIGLNCMNGKPGLDGTIRDGRFDVGVADTSDIPENIVECITDCWPIAKKLLKKILTQLLLTGRERDNVPRIVFLRTAKDDPQKLLSDGGIGSRTFIIRQGNPVGIPVGGTAIKTVSELQNDTNVHKCNLQRDAGKLSPLNEMFTHGKIGTDSATNL
jgi:hypothetical protein